MRIDPWVGASIRIPAKAGSRLRVLRVGWWRRLHVYDESEGTRFVIAAEDGPELNLTDPDTNRGVVARFALALGHPPELVAEGVWFGCRNGVWALVSGQIVRGEGPAASGVSSTMTTFGRECAGVEDRVEALRRAMERAG